MKVDWGKIGLVEDDREEKAKEKYVSPFSSPEDIPEEEVTHDGRLFPHLPPPSSLEDVNPPPVRETKGPPSVNNMATKMRKDPCFLARVKKAMDSKQGAEADLSEEDLAVLCEAVEASGVDGLSVDMFAAEIGFLPGEFLILVQRYPRLKKSAELSLIKRRKMMVEELMKTSTNKGAAFKALLATPELVKDQFTTLLSEEGGRSGATREQAERLLMAKGIPPMRPLRVLVLAGDKGGGVQISPEDMGLLKPDEVMEKLQ